MSLDELLGKIRDSKIKTSSKELIWKSHYIFTKFFNRINWFQHIIVEQIYKTISSLLVVCVGRGQ